MNSRVIPTQSAIYSCVVHTGKEVALASAASFPYASRHCAYPSRQVTVSWQVNEQGSILARTITMTCVYKMLCATDVCVYNCTNTLITATKRVSIMKCFGTPPVPSTISDYCKSESCHRMKNPPVICNIFHCRQSRSVLHHVSTLSITMPQSVNVALQIGDTKHQAMLLLVKRIDFIVQQAPQGGTVSGAGHQ